MEPLNARSMLDAATSAAAKPADRPFVERRQRLSAAALDVVNQKVARAYSPIVITGFVRLADFALLSLVGIVLYLGYVMPHAGSFSWIYPAQIIAVAVSAVVCFQAADIYQVQLFRGQLRQMTRMISSWSFVFLLFIGISFFAKFGSEISRLWLAAFYVLGLAALLCERLVLRSLVRAWGREGRLDRRTIIVGSDRNGEQLVEALKQQEDSDIHVLGVFDDRNDSRALDTCAGARKLGKVDDIVEFARRTRVDLVLFALPISAETRILEMLKKLWVLPVDIRLSAHTNKLRFRPRSYSYIGEVPTLDVFEAHFDHRLGPGDEMAVRPRGRHPRAARGLAGDGIGGAGREARQPRTRAIPPKALRLQQRAHRRLQVPLNVPSSG
ncbi:hypothetical protein ACVWZK_005166 [Bradyrhizobium sp. GM0.4]